jgi:hypothetical protein
LAKRGRPKGSGNPEDEPLLREAIRAIRKREFRSLRAAATELAKRLPGEEDVNRDRLYRKLRSRKEELEAELDAELGREEGTNQTLEERAEKLASELAGTSFSYKAKFLHEQFKILIVNAEVASYVLVQLEEDGLEIPPDFLTHLNRITDKIVEKERAAFEDSHLGRYLRREMNRPKK